MGQEILPPPGLFVDDALVELFVSTIDQLISDMGRKVTLFLPASTSGCPNCKLGFDGSSQGVYNNTNPFTLGGAYNKPFPQGGICPVCKGTHEIKTPRTVQYTALISKDPKDLDYKAFGKAFENNNVYRTKMQIVALEDIKIAEKALIDGDMCVPIRNPIRRGLRDLKYAQQWWKKMDK